MDLARTLISRGVIALIAGFFVVVFGSASCSDETPKAKGVDAACPSGEVMSPEGVCECPAATVPRAAGGCQPAGLPLDMPCPPGEMLLPEGGCEPAGIAPEACGEGFEPDGKRGCNAIQPEEDCPEGLMAIPGETTCREVAPCGSGTWGDIPVEVNTEFVDGSYLGGDSDGTEAKPWTTIQAGINAAEEEAIVAVAAGSYNESLLIDSKPVRLWGRCPSMVEVAGVDGLLYTILVIDSPGAELRGLAIRGPAIGLFTVDSTDVVADQVWIHHTGKDGVYIDNTHGPASLTVSSSLIEAIAEESLVSLGASLTLSRSVVRDTVSSTSRGVVVEEFMGERASLKILGSVISRTHVYGVRTWNANVQIEATLIRDIKQTASGPLGMGIFFIQEGEGGASDDATIRASVIEDNPYAGVSADGPGLVIESTVIRRTRPHESGNYGRGIELYPTIQGVRGSMTIRGSLVEDNHEGGIAILGSDAVIEGTIVRDTKQGMSSMLGVGVIVQHFDDTVERATATVRSSVIQGNVSTGILVAASDATIETSIIADTMPSVEGYHGDGILIQGLPGSLERATAIVRSCLIERNIQTGVMVVSSDATIETSHVRDTQPNPEGTLGDGIAVIFEWSPATAKLYGTLVESSARTGIASFGGHIELTRMAVTCGALDINGEAHEGSDFIVDDRGGTACGCPAATERCRVQSSGLQPPLALENF